LDAIHMSGFATQEPQYELRLCPIKNEQWIKQQT
jgi:hypothetical protein